MVDSFTCLRCAECSRAPNYVINGHGCPMQTISCTWRLVVPIGEDPAAHGHWCTFTDLYHTIPCLYHATGVLPSTQWLHLAIPTSLLANACVLSLASRAMADECNIDTEQPRKQQPPPLASHGMCVAYLCRWHVGREDATTRLSQAIKACLRCVVRTSLQKQRKLVVRLSHKQLTTRRKQ